MITSIGMGTGSLDLNLSFNSFTMNTTTMMTTDITTSHLLLVVILLKIISRVCKTLKKRVRSGSEMTRRKPHNNLSLRIQWPGAHWCLGLAVPTQTWAVTLGCGWQLQWWSQTPECLTGTWRQSPPAGHPWPAGRQIEIKAVSGLSCEDVVLQWWYWHTTFLSPNSIFLLMFEVFGVMPLTCMIPARNVTEEATSTLCSSLLRPSNPVMLAGGPSSGTSLVTTEPIMRHRTGNGPAKSEARVRSGLFMGSCIETLHD